MNRKTKLKNLLFALLFIGCFLTNINSQENQNAKKTFDTSNVYKQSEFSISIEKRIEDLGLTYKVENYSIDSSYLNNTEMIFGDRNASKTIILTTPITSETNTKTSEFLLQIAKILSQQEISNTKGNLSETLVKIIFTRDDYSALPENLSKNMPAGTKQLSNTIDTSSPCAVIIFEENLGDSIYILNGSKNKITPLWLLEHFLKLNQAVPFTFTYNRMELYRLGWTESHALLKNYLDNDIASILFQLGDKYLENQDIEHLAQIFASSVTNITPLPSAESDIHYLIFSYKNHFLIFDEFTMIILITIICCCIFIGLGGIGFIFSKKSEQHWKDTKKTWYLIPIYLIVTYFALVMGKFFVLKLFEHKYGFADAWEIMPIFSTVIKFLVVAIILSMITTLQQMISLPTDNYIYGLIASLSCLLNIFLFSSQDFSLSIIFIWAYFCSFIFYHCKKIGTSIFWAIAMTIPFVSLFPAFSTTIIAGNQFYQTLFMGNNNWQIYLSFFLFPIVMMIARLRAMTGILGKTEKFRLPILLFILIAMLFSSSIWFLIKPQYNKTNELNLEISEQINEKEHFVKVVSPFKLDNVLLLLNNKHIFIPLKKQNSQYEGTAPLSSKTNALETNVQSKKFLDKAIYTISINPSEKEKKAIRYDVTISTKQGLAIFDASIPYEMKKGGSVCVFSTGEFPPVPFVFEFSTSLSTKLEVEVIAYIEQEKEKFIPISNIDFNTTSLKKITKIITLGKVANE